MRDLYRPSARASVLCGLTALLARLAAAQSTVPTEMQRRLIQIGFAPPVEASMAVYAPLLAQAPKDGVRITRDLSYGPHARHRVDVYQPMRGERLPILAFVHGGGYRTRDKNLNEHVYGNIPTYFARRGVLGINATYRLAPEAAWPSGAEDMRALVAWIKQNAGSYGGDPDRVFMMGHSAGATHVASYAFDRRFQPPEGHGLSGVVLVSGRYRLRWDPDDPGLDGIRQYFGQDPTRYESRSVINHVTDSEIPAMLVIAEYDQRNLVETTAELFAALCQRDDGRCPRLIQLNYHNHLSEVFHFNTSDDLLGLEILDFINRGAASQLLKATAR